MSSIDFCAGCGCWIAANTGTMKLGPDGEAEIICQECEQLEQQRACPVGHDSRSGTLDPGGGTF